VLADCARTARETFDRRIEVSSHAEPGLPLVRARASELHQALLNLCINARDAMPDGGRLHLSAASDARGPLARPDGAPAGPWVRLEVRDSGSGMDEATRARIFEPFFTTKPKGKGTGLGLFMVYSTLRSLGGAVEVDSAAGQGTVFRAFLPVAPNAEAPGAVPAAEPEGPARPARILLVEDEEMLRSLAEVVLRGQGHTVETAVDGAEAVARLEAEGPPPDVVILDLVLPRISGADVFRRLRRRHPGLPVLLTSGQMEGDALDDDVRAGVAAVLPKPYRPAELVAAVRRALAAARP
jgi:two-component system cell cycle sensor histidine kinase/response regulator CckA